MISDCTFDQLPMGCPLDGTPLALAAGSLICSDGHSFDIAKQGYANLLPVQFKPSRDPGDNKSMVDARRTVFAAGLFDVVASALVSVVAPLLEQHTSQRAGRRPCLVDAGCGEGYYTQTLCTQLSTSTLGVDISKPAIQLAARHYRAPCFVIANNKTLPVTYGSASVITSLFGFETWEPWSALQTPGQYVVCVDAGIDHLREMRQVVYPTVVTHEPPLPPLAAQQGYRLTDTVPVKKTHRSVPPTLTDQLLAMTPHGVKTGRAGSQALQDAGTIDITVDAVIRVYRLG